MEWGLARTRQRLPFLCGSQLLVSGFRWDMHTYWHYPAAPRDPRVS